MKHAAALLLRARSEFWASVVRERNLGGLVLSLIPFIVISSAAYGAVLAGWRSSQLSLYVAVKMPCLLLGTTSLVMLLNWISATLLGSRLTFKQVVAITYGTKGIGVSCLCPQAVRTGMTAGRGSNLASHVDGMAEPESVADLCLETIREERFLVLPHPEVETYMRRKATDYDRWIGGMQRLAQKWD